jgi:hypothetical protein
MIPNMKSQKPLSRKENIVVQELEGEILVYDLSENRAVCLNETSALIWQACDGNKTPAEISNFISKKLNTPANEDLVWLALDQLKKENLIENASDLPNHFAGMSRREAIKKVGLSSLIALPVIMAVTSPVAAATGSVCGAVLNAVCRCDFGGDVGPTPGQQSCFNDLTLQCQQGGVECQCVVPGGTSFDTGAGAYPGTCRESAV